MQRHTILSTFFIKGSASSRGNVNIEIAVGVTLTVIVVLAIIAAIIIIVVILLVVRKNHGEFVIAM